jgi:AraC-like DNA-binding protein
MPKQKIQANFYSKTPLKTDDVQLIGWSGNHWDNISYFPKNYQIALIRAGEGEIIVGDVTYHIHKNQFFLIHPNLVHSGKPNVEIGWQVDTITLKTSFVQQIMGNNSLPIFEKLIFEDENYLRIFEDCIQLLNNYEENFESESKFLFYLSELLIIPSKKTEIRPLKDDNEAINRAINFIEANYKTAFTLDDVSENAFLSKFHLIRIFKKQVGLTPYSYQLQLKLNEARRLIFEDKSLTEIAHELGFADQAHFTNTFKKYANGANPSDLLKTAISFNFKE